MMTTGETLARFGESASVSEKSAWSSHMMHHTPSGRSAQHATACPFKKEMNAAWLLRHWSVAFAKHVLLQPGARESPQRGRLLCAPLQVRTPDCAAREQRLARRSALRLHLGNSSAAIRSPPIRFQYSVVLDRAAPRNRESARSDPPHTSQTKSRCSEARFVAFGRLQGFK